MRNQERITLCQKHLLGIQAMKLKITWRKRLRRRSARVRRRMVEAVQVHKQNHSGNKIIHPCENMSSVQPFPLWGGGCKMHLERREIRLRMISSQNICQIYCSQKVESIQWRCKMAEESHFLHRVTMDFLYSFCCTLENPSTGTVESFNVVDANFRGLWIFCFFVGM